MKIFKSLAVLFILLSLNTKGQDKRFFDKIFTDITIDSNIVYGANYTYDNTQGQAGTTQDSLLLDIYYPTNDQSTEPRPLIIWVHGGYFLVGSKADEDIVHFCKEYAARGFVTAAINYRLGFEMPIDSVNAVRAVYRALQDGRAATRYLRSVADEYNIDKNRVYMGGTSAGAFVAINIAYFNTPEECPSYLDTNERLSVNTIPGFGLDGYEGLTNTIEESSEIQGIININGATKVVSWMDDPVSASIPMISLHGTADSTVPYGTRVINVADVQTNLPKDPPVPLIAVQGSYDMDKHAKKMGYQSSFYTWYHAPHSPHLGFKDNDTAAAYMDTVMSFTVKHVYEDFLQLGTVPGLEENKPPCDYNNGDFLPCRTSSVTENSGLSKVFAYPNPMENETKFVLPQEFIMEKALAIDMLGKKYELEMLSSSSVNTENLEAGKYQLLLIGSSGEELRFNVMK